MQKKIYDVSTNQTTTVDLTDAEKTAHENKKELDENWDLIKKHRNKKVNGELLEKHIKKNRDIRYGRNLRKKKEQSTFEF